MWTQRPLASDMILYAAEDVAQLLALADKLTADLGPTHPKLVKTMSATYSRSRWSTLDKAKYDKPKYGENAMTVFNSESWIGQLSVKPERLSMPSYRAE